MKNHSFTISQFEYAGISIATVYVCHSDEANCLLGAGCVNRAEHGFHYGLGIIDDHNLVNDPMGMSEVW